MNQFPGSNRPLSVQGDITIKIGATAASLFGIGFTYGFFTHEHPPTTGHVVAGFAVGIPAFLILILIAVSANTRWIVGAQGVAMVALFIALSEQQLPKDIAYVFAVLLLCLLPMGITSVGLRYNKKNAGKVPYLSTILNQHNIFYGLMFVWALIKILGYIKGPH